MLRREMAKPKLKTVMLRKMILYRGMSKLKHSMLYKGMLKPKQAAVYRAIWALPGIRQHSMAQYSFPRHR